MAMSPAVCSTDMKKSGMDSLAVFGGSPAFAEKLHVGRPNLGDRAQFLARMNDIWDRRWLSNGGKYVVELEARVREITGARHAILFCNATVGLEVAMRAADLAGEVIVPGFTFVATAHAAHWLGIKPVFADVEFPSHVIDPATIEARITPRTTAILAVHLWGTPCDVEALETIARRHRLKLLFDAAHAFACGTPRGMIGTFGLGEVFSFHATKFLNSFEGGALTTNDDDYARRVRQMLNFGFVGYDHVISDGTNAKMTEPAAAMALTNLDAMPQFIAVNRRNHDLYVRHLAGVPGVSVYPHATDAPRNFQYLLLDIDPGACPISRDRLLQVLGAENVVARRYFFPGVHRMEPYRTLFPEQIPNCPVSDEISRRIVVLPTGTAMSPTDVEALCGVIRTAAAHGPEIERRLAGTPNPCAPPIPGAP
jgi:dTDP-4-amino-4,6-dideoxygalactose transaminase